MPARYQQAKAFLCDARNTRLELVNIPLSYGKEFEFDSSSGKVSKMKARAGQPGKASWLFRYNGGRRVDIELILCTRMHFDHRSRHRLVLKASVFMQFSTAV